MEYNIKLTSQDLQVIFMALGELPMKIAAPVFVKIEQQKKEEDKVSG